MQGFFLQPSSYELPPLYLSLTLSLSLSLSLSLTLSVTLSTTNAVFHSLSSKYVIIIDVIIYITKYMVVTISLSGVLVNQMQYNLESAQYLW